MAQKQRVYFCIDMKTFYASVECAERGLNPFETNLAVVDENRGKNALCLAITPKMKAQGIKNRCRMSEIPKQINFIRALPRMQLYIDYAADIYEIYLNYSRLSRDDAQKSDHQQGGHICRLHLRRKGRHRWHNSNDGNHKPTIQD